MGSLRFPWLWKKRPRTRYEPPPSPTDEETLLHGEESEEEEEEEGEEVTVRGRRSVKPSLWVILSVVATLGSRRVLRGGFGECFRILERKAEMGITC
jgi:hypothetical protein